MNFWLGGFLVKNARDIEYENNGDRTLWNRFWLWRRWLMRKPTNFLKMIEYANWLKSQENDT